MDDLSSDGEHKPESLVGETCDPAPFLTCVNVGNEGRSFAKSESNNGISSTEDAIFDGVSIPQDLRLKICKLPEKADVKLTINASTSTLLFDDPSQAEIWHKYFSSKLSQDIITEAFWWTVVRHSSALAQGQLLLLETIKRRIAHLFVRLFLRIEKRFKDLICDNYHDALAQTVFYLLFTTYPEVRQRLTTAFSATLIKSFSEWIMGPVLPSIDIRHWKLQHDEECKPIGKPRKKAKSLQKTLQECLDIVDRTDKRPSEKVAFIHQRRDEYIYGTIPLKTVKVFRGFGNSQLVSEYLKCSPYKTFIKERRVLITSEISPQQHRAETMFMRKLKESRLRSLNRSLHGKVQEIRKASELEELQDLSQKKNWKREFNIEYRQAKAHKADTIAGILKAIEEDVGHGLGVSKNRSLSDSVRAEFKLGPAPAIEW
uniref:Uncharacterized protein n=1 Tax=Spongospora subterranea TaxID=70186 RepID=A0A0H5R6L7_9EUKA|eukprot:CRZ09770.1 hypothetical protein [Spongospora subterranea]